MTNDPDAGSVIAAADAAGAPLSELSRLLMHHEPTMTVTVPDWVADRVICAARLWGVTEPVAGAWLLAEGTTSVGGHEILPSGGHVAARWRPTVLPSGGQQNCPR